MSRVARNPVHDVVNLCAWVAWKSRVDLFFGEIDFQKKKNRKKDNQKCAFREWKHEIREVYGKIFEQGNYVQLWRKIFEQSLVFVEIEEEIQKSWILILGKAVLHCMVNHAETLFIFREGL